VISDGITTQALISFGSPRYFDAKQLEWRIEASHEQV
jgi:hypothetical protein